MKLFKKKYERSEWFEGLLEAEKLYAEGYHYHKNDGVHIWFESNSLNDWNEEFGLIHSYEVYKVSDPQYIGVMDYLSYREEFLR